MDATAESERNRLVSLSVENEQVVVFLKLSVYGIFCTQNYYTVSTLCSNTSSSINS